jgi:hypothetical protein
MSRAWSVWKPGKRCGRTAPWYWRDLYWSRGLKPDNPECWKEQRGMDARTATNIARQFYDLAQTGWEAGVNKQVRLIVRIRRCVWFSRRRRSPEQLGSASSAHNRKTHRETKHTEGPILTVEYASEKHQAQVALWAVQWRCRYFTGAKMTLAPGANLKRVGLK